MASCMPRYSFLGYCDSKVTVRGVKEQEWSQALLNVQS